MLGFSCDLLEQLAFYGSYHRNRWNQLIHFVFVPLIVWSAAVWACYTGPLVGVDLPALAAHVLPVSIAKCSPTPSSHTATNNQLAHSAVASTFRISGPSLPCQIKMSTLLFSKIL